MEYTFLILSLMHQMGVTLGVGASTFALIFYIQATRDGNVDATERRFLHTVFTVLRIGMALLTLAAILIVIAVHARDQSAFDDVRFLTQVTILAVILGNALLMTLHKMPMWLGPVLAGGSWYALFLVGFLPFQNPAYPFLLMLYGAFVCIFFAVYTYIKNIFTDPVPAIASEAVSEEAKTVDESVTKEETH